jgi:hypothetical protein
MIRFYGLHESLAKWRDVVAARVGKQGGAVTLKPDRFGGRHYFDVDLTDSDRQLLTQDWHAPSGTSNDAQGRPLTWNCCIAFEEL